MRRPGLWFMLIVLHFVDCGEPEKVPAIVKESTALQDNRVESERTRNKAGVRTVHILVALCDNKYQGIVPVPKSIGNGQDPASNLYWGCDLGLKTYFKRKTSDWNLVSAEKTGKDTIMERLLFRHKSQNVYLLADAYNGKYIKKTIEDFIQDLAGNQEEKIIRNQDTLWFGGFSNLVGYIGHNGLMDFELPAAPLSKDTVKREAIILACASKPYFAPIMKRTGATPLLWTTNLMCPEAYTLHDALGAWILQKSPEEVRSAAALAYTKYQKCSLRGARSLLVAGY